MPLTEDQREQLIEEHIQSAHGRALIAKSMEQPVRLRIDYESPSLKLFMHSSVLVDSPEWTEPALEEVFDDTAWFGPIEGETVGRMFERAHLAMVHTMRDWITGKLHTLVEERAKVLPTASLTQEAFDEALDKTPSGDPGGRMMMNARAFGALRKADWFRTGGEEDARRRDLLGGTFGMYRGRAVITGRQCEEATPYWVAFSGKQERVGVARYDLNLSWVEEPAELPEGCQHGIRMQIRLLAGMVADPELYIRRFEPV